MKTRQIGRSATPKECSRRTFLAGTGRVMAAGGVAQMLSPHVYAADNNTIRLALIGCGGRGTGAVADAFAATAGPVKLHAMADVFEDRLNSSHANLTAAYSDRVDVPADRRFLGFDGYKKAIDTLKEGDVAILATHAAFRPPHFEYAVNRGVNVFMEKSFAADSPAARRLLKSVEVSEKKGLKVGVGFMWRHSAARQQLIRRIHDGAIGDVHTLRIYRVHGPAHCPPLPKGANETEFQVRHATSFTWASSGFFIDWHCHNVDVACWAKNAWPVSAQAMGGRCYPESGSQFDHFAIEYTFADGGKLFSFSRHMTGCWETYSDYAHGSKGSACIMATLGEPRSKMYKSQNMIPEEVIWQFEGRDPNPYHAEWQVLLDAIRGNKPHNESRRAVDASVAALMGRMAAHTGRFVTWEQAFNSQFQFVADIDSLTFDTPAPIKAGPDGRYDPPQPGITVEI